MNRQDSYNINNGEAVQEPETYQVPNILSQNTPGEPSSSSTGSTLDRYDVQQLRELPEDDGMMFLRKKIHAIRDNNTTSLEKARLIHSLMTESYDSARKVLGEHQASLLRSPSSVRSVDQSRTSSPQRIRRSLDQLSLDRKLSTVALSINNSYNLTPEDLEPTYAPNDPIIATDPSNTPTSDAEPNDGDETDSDYSDENVMILGCHHYKRNVKLQCYTCKKWYTCRFCHDESEDHALERRKTENMLCMLCGLPQPAAQWCKGCGESAASYFCEVCKLWDNDSSKSIYHCYDCGICRIGQGIGKDFYHCKTCSVCIPISIENTHRCIERSTQCDCPICGEYMFTSPDTVVFMRCGHSIHQKCYSDYSKTSYRCPICSKSITNMEARFRNLDRLIDSQPMPNEFKDTRALVYCNDCGARTDVPYHWLGLKCDLCESYNTAQIHLRSGADEVDGEDIMVSRAQSFSFNLPEHTCESLPASSLLTESLQNDHDLWRPMTSSSADGRPSEGTQQSRPQQTSRIVGNYFDLSRDSAWTPSIFSSRRSDEGSDTEELGFWANSPLRKYSFFGKQDKSETESDGVSNEDDDGGIGEEEEEEDDDDDDIDPIEIFGHR
ncbi:zinc-ribbon-domain-containing protein [Talaromyces proteolyticus]|uniref:Zinc-ribbon-domain-containing protein n=1 Tax=Talaromyces proteolyticus TaxID=1131652 RepID=A0AAD4KIA7_9EURO|nr:zinc-ribbon-domain-containing protein [Talaromyces proteolyticus]KAH8693082.1 zinc-ribbon-domain-containing protein [Talaromyces proteolyticus]